jgi:aminoglycoside phosphotransferase (APT) family kinase protein
VSLGQYEARFYRDLAPTLPLEVPPCVHAGIDAVTGHGLVLMHDLVDAGSTFLTALSPYSVEQAAATLAQLARLHHADPARCAGGVGWLAPRLAGYLYAVDETRLQSLLDDGRCAAFSPQIAQASRVRAAFAAVAERGAAHAGCVIHGDAHAGNLYLTPDGAPGLIDWQVLQLGPWAFDVAYHLTAVLDVPDRAARERSLLAHYLDVRRSLGDDVPPLDDAWDAYRDAMAYGFYMWAITQRVERPVIETFVTRLGLAVEHHETFERLGV